MGVETVIAVAAAVSAGVAIDSNRQSKKQARTARLQKGFEEAKSRRQVLAEAKVLRARTTAQAEQQGISGASSVQGATASIDQQAADTISFQQSIGSFQNQIAKSQQRINNLATIGNVAGAAGSVAASFQKPVTAPQTT